jgi:hypothetical protein
VAPSSHRVVLVQLVTVVGKGLRTIDTALGLISELITLNTSKVLLTALLVRPPVLKARRISKGTSEQM